MGKPRRAAVRRKFLKQEAVGMRKGGKGLVRAAILTSILMTLLCGQAMAATLGPSSKGDAVTALQQNLKAKGYYTAKITKTYTAALYSSVRVFQKANSIEPKKKYGYADDETQEKAASTDAVTYAEYQEKLADGQLQPGGSGTHVKKAQTYLKKLGYYSGSVSGRYGSTTESAVRLFQTANGLSVSGRADGTTRAVLYSKTAVTRAQYEAANYLTPLKYGAKDEAQVTQLQEKLAEKGFYWDAPNGRFDTQTKYSVKLFQVANGYSASGSASRTLRALLNSGSSQLFEILTEGAQSKALSTKSKAGLDVAALQVRLRDLGYYKGVITGVYSSSVVTAVKSFQSFNYPALKVTGSADTATRTLMNDENALSYDTVCGSDTLKTGAKGDAVVTLQNKLKALGYYRGDADGVYDSGVASAVKLFQKYNKLYQSGIAYTPTIKALDSASVVSYPKAKIEALIVEAYEHLGKPYRSPASAPKTFDCSTYTAYCLRKIGVYVTSEVQAQGKSMYKKWTVIDNYKQLKRGDIVFFDTQPKKKPGHSGIFLGITGSQYRFIHASSSKGKVTVTDMNSSYSREYYLGKNGTFMWGVRIWE